MNVVLGDKRWPTLDEVLAKAEWREDDITVLVAHKDVLDAKTLKKLGIAPRGEVTDVGAAQDAVEAAKDAALRAATVGAPKPVGPKAPVEKKEKAPVEKK